MRVVCRIAHWGTLQYFVAVELAMAAERWVGQYLRQLVAIVIDLLTDSSEMFLFRSPISTSHKALSRLNMQVILGAVQLSSSGRDAGTKPGLIGCLVLAEAGVAVNTEHTFRHRYVGRNKPVGFRKALNDRLGKIFHVLPGLLIIFTMRLKPFTIVIFGYCR